MPTPQTIPDICAALTQQGYPDLAKRLAYFASDEDLEEGDVPVTLESALGFWGFFLETGHKEYVGSGCSQEGWICADWEFEDDARAAIWFLDKELVMFALRGSDGKYIRINEENKCHQDKLLVKLIELGLVTAQKAQPLP